MIPWFMSHAQTNLNSMGRMSRKRRMSRHKSENFEKRSNSTSDQKRLAEGGGSMAETQSKYGKIRSMGRQ